MRPGEEIHRFLKEKLGFEGPGYPWCAGPGEPLCVDPIHSAAKDAIRTTSAL